MAECSNSCSSSYLDGHSVFLAHITVHVTWDVPSHISTLSCYALVGFCIANEYATSFFAVVVFFIFLSASVLSFEQHSDFEALDSFCSLADLV